MALISRAYMDVAVFVPAGIRRLGEQPTAGLLVLDAFFQFEMGDVRGYHILRAL